MIQALYDVDVDLLTREEKEVEKWVRPAHFKEVFLFLLNN